VPSKRSRTSSLEKMWRFWVLYADPLPVLSISMNLSFFLSLIRKAPMNLCEIVHSCLSVFPSPRGRSLELFQKPESLSFLFVIETVCCKELKHDTLQEDEDLLIGT